MIININLIQQEQPMILSDFLTLELYFDNQESAQFFEECSKKYGKNVIQKCIKAGELACRRVYLGPDTGKKLLWLTPQGRQKAQAAHM